MGCIITLGQGNSLSRKCAVGSEHGIINLPKRSISYSYIFCQKELLKDTITSDRFYTDSRVLEYLEDNYDKEKFLKTRPVMVWSWCSKISTNCSLFVVFVSQIKSTRFIVPEKSFHLEWLTNTVIIICTTITNSWTNFIWSDAS